MMACHEARSTWKPKDRIKVSENTRAIFFRGHGALSHPFCSRSEQRLLLRKQNGLDNRSVYFDSSVVSDGIRCECDFS